MRVEVDIADVRAIATKAISHLRRVPMLIFKRLQKQAQLARRSHRYQNRTRRLQQSTFAMGPVTAGNDATVTEFGARMPYAGYVEDRGFQDLAGHARTATTDIANILIDAARGL